MNPHNNLSQHMFVPQEEGVPVNVTWSTNHTIASVQHFSSHFLNKEQKEQEKIDIDHASFMNCVLNITLFLFYVQIDNE